MPPIPPLTLISHPLCPYVQRAAIALAEKGVAFERVDIDLATKPEWFVAISPLGKTPVLRVGSTAIFESAVILEYLEETQPHALHPAAPLRRAEHRGWIEFGSAILNDIAGLYNAPNQSAFLTKGQALRERFERVEAVLQDGPFFDGNCFCLVDAAFAPIFRYFDALDRIQDFGILTGMPKMDRWRRALEHRASIRHAVTRDYPHRLWQFFLKRNSHLSSLMSDAERRTTEDPASDRFGVVPAVPQRCESAATSGPA